MNKKPIKNIGTLLKLYDDLNHKQAIESKDDPDIDYCENEIVELRKDENTIPEEEHLLTICNDTSEISSMLSDLTLSENKVKPTLLINGTSTGETSETISTCSEETFQEDQMTLDIKKTQNMKFMQMKQSLLGLKRSMALSFPNIDLDDSTNKESRDKTCDPESNETELFLNIKPYNLENLKMNNDTNSNIISMHNNSGEEEWKQSEIKTNHINYSSPEFEPGHNHQACAKEIGVEEKSEFHLVSHVENYLQEDIDKCIQTEKVRITDVTEDRHYIIDEKINFEEDICHEFKGHRSISVYDIPNMSCTAGLLSRNSVSA